MCHLISRYLPLALEKQPHLIHRGPNPGTNEVISQSPTDLSGGQNLDLGGLHRCFQEVHKAMLIFVPEHQQFAIGSP